MNKVLIVESEGSYDIYADDGVLVERVNLDSREPITLNLAFEALVDAADLGCEIGLDEFFPIANRAIEVGIAKKFPYRKKSLLANLIN